MYQRSYEIADSISSRIFGYTRRTIVNACNDNVRYTVLEASKVEDLVELFIGEIIERQTR